MIKLKELLNEGGEDTYKELMKVEKVINNLVI